ncbi:MAG: hypothetical protein JNM89_10560 [Hyphomicrobiaceae bacterium]|nr:hypothetical protein [Hyphomicrobiaceae bacterium]
MRRRALVTACVAALQAWLAGSVDAEPSIGQFELKDLEAEPGEIEFQSQNAWSFGNPRRRFSEEAPGAFVYDDNSATKQRHALEIEMSLTRWFRTRVGIEYEKERLEDPPSPALADAYAPLELTEVALEGVVILKHVPEGGVGFGLLGEFEHPLGRGEMNSILFGPIVGTKSGPWSALLNVMLVHKFGSGETSAEGLERDDKWDLAYAAQLKYAFDPRWALALEAYGTFDRLGHTGEPGEGALAFGDHDQHRIGPIAYYTWRKGESGAVRGLGRLPAGGLDDDDAKPGGGGEKDDDVTVTLGTGLLFGLNGNTPDATLKASLEVEF